MRLDKGDMLIYMLLLTLMMWSFYVIKMTGQFILK